MAIEESQSTVDVLYRISRLVGNTEDPNEALNLILKEVVDQLNCTSASIALINPDTNLLEIEVHHGLPEEFQDLKLPLQYGVTGWVALHAKPLLVSDVTQDPRYFTVRTSVKSEMAVPMEIEGMVIGVVNVDSDITDAFSETDLKMLSLITSEATRVVNRLWFINQLKIKAAHFQSLVKTGQKLVSHTELDKILKSIAREARKLLKCRLCSIHLVTPNQTLRLHTVSGGGGHIDYEEELSLKDSSMGAAILRNKQIEVLRLSRTEEHHFIPLIHREKLVSLLSSPLVFDDQPIGVLNVYTKNAHRFNNDEKKLIATLASMGAVAIQNARLYDRVFESEESLRKNEKLTTLGLLAAEIAHEIRNPLTVIKLLFESLELDYDDDDPRRTDMTVIGEKLQQLEAIVTRVLKFGKSKEALSTPISMADVVDETLLLVRLKLNRSNIRIHFINEANFPTVEVNKGQIQQVLLNLILNAEQAMPMGGQLTIKLSNHEIANKECAVVQVEDTGQGIPEELRERIFDSFLSNKPDGTGLGLSIVKRIMRQHMGDIELVSSSVHGTVFQLWLPSV